MRSYEVTLNVTGDVDLPGTLFTAATLYLPDRVDGPLTLMVAYPGGTYNRGYYDLRAVPGYSQAEHHVDQGFAFLACDHLGVGGSAVVDPFDLTFERLAAANHATAGGVVQRLRAGTLADGLGPVAVDRMVGMGQSMGGCLVVVQQAIHRTFDAVAILGYSCIGPSFAAPDGSRMKFPAPPRGSDLRAGATRALGDVHAHVEMLRYCFHAADEDPALADPDKAFSPEARSVSQAAPWRAAVLPPCAATMMADGVVAVEAAAIEAPVLIASGEIDIVPDPWAEPTFFRGSRDVAVFVVPGMCHMHNFARTRGLLWERLAQFARGVATA